MTREWKWLFGTLTRGTRAQEAKPSDLPHFQRFSATWPIHRGASCIVEHHHRQQTPTLSAERFRPSVLSVSSHGQGRKQHPCHIRTAGALSHHYLSVEQAIKPTSLVPTARH